MQEASYYLLWVLLAGDSDRALGDVLGQIADTFQVARDTDGGDDLAEIGGDWLAPCDDRDCILINRALQAVYGLVVFERHLSKIGITVAERVDGLSQRMLSKPTHVGDHCVQGLQF